MPARGKFSKIPGSEDLQGAISRQANTSQAGKGGFLVIINGSLPPNVQNTNPA